MYQVILRESIAKRWPECAQCISNEEYGQDEESDYRCPSLFSRSGCGLVSGGNAPGFNRGAMELLLPRHRRQVKFPQNLRDEILDVIDAQGNFSF